MNESRHTDSSALILSVALVWFSTHVGGGFASGASHFAYFIDYGFWSLVLAPVSLAFIAFVYWWGWRHARIHGTYDYRTFNDSFYGKYAPVMSNLYEVLIAFVVVIGCGVAFATGSSLIAELTGLSLPLAGVLIGLVIFAVCIFGTHVVRRASAVLSAMMIAALLLIYVPAIVTHAGELGATLSTMRAEASPAGFLAALGGAAMYAVYQSSDVAIYVQHVRPLAEVRSVGKALALSYVINLVFFAVTLFGLLTVASTPGIESAAVPLLVVIDGLPGAAGVKIAAAALISIACISTAVTFISGMVKRLCVRFEGATAVEAAEDRKRPTRLGILFAFVLTLMCFGVAQFGLLALVQKGYSFLGYLAIPVVAIPYVLNFIWAHTKGKACATPEEEERS